MIKQIKLWWFRLISNIGYLFVITADRMISVWPDKGFEVCPNCLTDRTTFFSPTGDDDLEIHKCIRCGYYFMVDSEED